MEVDLDRRDARAPHARTGRPPIGRAEPALDRLRTRRRTGRRTTGSDDGRPNATDEANARPARAGTRILAAVGVRMTARSISAHAPSPQRACGPLDPLALPLQPSRPASVLQGSGQRLPTCDPRPGDRRRANFQERRPPKRTARMRFKVLGPLEVSREGGPLPLGGPKQRTVLAHLILNANQVVPAERPDRRAVGRGTTRRRARDAAELHLAPPKGARPRAHRGPRARLPAPCRTATSSMRCGSNASCARRAARTASPSRLPRRCARRSRSGRGPALADLASEPSLAAEIARLEELRLQAHRGTDRGRPRQGRHGEVVGELEALTRELPAAGAPVGASSCSRCTASAGRRTRWRRSNAPATILADELGVDPSPDSAASTSASSARTPTSTSRASPSAATGCSSRSARARSASSTARSSRRSGARSRSRRCIPSSRTTPTSSGGSSTRRRSSRASSTRTSSRSTTTGASPTPRTSSCGSCAAAASRTCSRPVRSSRSRVAAIIDQIASALAAAHRQGIVHRDVKPGNVLLDEEGNAYLTDFGVALDAGSPETTTGTMMRGTPAYLSPEQIRLEPASPRSDVVRAGDRRCSRCSRATHPFPETSLTALLDRHAHDAAPIGAQRATGPAAPTVDAVIARATAKDAGERFADVTSSRRSSGRRSRERRVVDAAIGPRPATRTRACARSSRPTRATSSAARGRHRSGSSAASPSDDAAARFLAVVGPSGSGKSSVVRAGLVPALRRGAIPGSERWYVIDVLPGPHPFRELETALLGVAVEPPPSLMEELERDELGLVRAANACSPTRRRAPDRRRSARGGLHARSTTRSSARTSSRACEPRPSSPTAGSASSRPCARLLRRAAHRCVASATCWPREPRRSRRCRPRSSSARSSPPPTGRGSSSSRGCSPR